MDASPDRPGAGQRLSRLPVPRPVSGIPRPASGIPGPPSLRRAPSTEGLGGRDLHLPRLRAAPSRGQLRPGPAHAPGPDSPQRAASSRDQPPPPPAVRPKPRTSRVASQPQRPTTTAADQPSTRRAVPLDSPPGPADADALDLDDDDTLSSLPVQMPPFATPRTAKSRPSLSERTMETLAQLPSSPALTKRPSLFFDQIRPGSRPESANSRPGSSYNSDGSARAPSGRGSRACSTPDHEELTAPSLRTPANSFKSSLSATNSTLQRRPESFIGKTPSSSAKSNRASMPPASRLPGSATSPLPEAKSPSPGKKPYARAPPKSGPKTAATKPAKPRAPANELHKKPSLPALGRSAQDPAASGRASSELSERPAASWDGTIPPASSTSAGLGPPPPPAHSLSNRKSSAALREQIAKAKAAKRAAARHAPGGQAAPSDAGAPIVPSDDGFDFGLEHDDPFNLRRGEDPGKKVLQQRVAAARSSGRLNIAALGLKEMPAEVLKMYDLESVGAHGGSWAESVDLTRLVAADNEIETLDDAVFPDVSPDAFDDDENNQGNMFGGLETLDFHGNLLIGVPSGFRRLVHLTSLNLSSNRLENDCLDVISQMTALRDLKLSKNRLSGPLSPAVSKLESLEMLDVQGNSITALPGNVDKMSRLRILNLGENQLEWLPFDSLAKLPLTELVARKNKLSGILIRDPVESLPFLQTLDASSNQLTHLVAPEAAVCLPVVHAVSVSMNRLQELPDMTTWTNLLTLAVDENNISSIPHSFTGLEKLRHADLGSNDIRTVPPEVARMGSLSMIRLTGNPLRDKKLASATTDELKEFLAARLEPPPPYQEPSTITDLMGRLVEMDSKVDVVGNADGEMRSDGEEDFATPPTSAPHSPAHSRSQTACSNRTHAQPPGSQAWPVKAGGLLDRSRTESWTLEAAMCAEVAGKHQVRQAQLHHNQFTSIPGSLATFGATLSSLSLAYNQLAGDAFLTEELELPALREINLSSNHITSLGPLTRFLRAPGLDKIDVTLNRITALPGNLRQAFPQLTVLLASSNQLAALEPESIRGLRMVDASSNDIGHLNPRIGLLGGQGGLQRLEVTGNRFKVPRWTILERGTEATLQWLRGRVPAAEMAAWRAENGEESGDDVD